FVGRGELVEQVTKIIGERQKRSRVTWSMVRSSVGLGRTRCLSEIKRSLNEKNISFLHIRFTESEQRLPLRALSLAVNEQLQALEATSPHVFQSLMQDMAMIAGKGAIDVARLIPALRPHIFKNSTITATHDTVGKEADYSDEDSVTGAVGTKGFFSHTARNTPMSRRNQPRAPIQQIFSELLGKISEQKGYLVFLLDDLHLADNQSIGLFQFITERVNDSANFAFVMTIREGIAPTNFVLENFLVRLTNLRRRFHVWDLSPLNQFDFQQFLQAVGLQRPSPRFVEFVTAKCDGSPLLLHQLLKQMVESDALLLDGEKLDPWAPRFKVDWSKLSQIVVDTRNIEALLASLDRMDKRDKKITSISAVSHEACEFEYFRFEQEFTSVELETRLLSLVRRGVFEMLGDENAPVQRRSFVFSHEKLRAAVLGGLDPQLRRQLHLSLANRIIYLYPKPRKEHVLSLAKHFEGAGTLADAERASTIFLKAAQIYAKNFEHSLSKYYTERAMQRASTIGNQQERLARLREVFETEYTIHIAQNELVAASEVCQQLVALTFEQSKKEILQVHWSNLLLGLGQHKKAFMQLKEAVDRKFPLPFSSLNQMAAQTFATLGRFGLFSFLLKVLTLKVFRKPNPGENNSHALMYMILAQAHGADGNSMPFLTAALQYHLHRSGPSRIVAVFNMMIAIQAMRFGKIDQAFDIAERLERSLERSGRVDVVRWVRALRAIWIDYPMGRMERLARILDARKEGQVPASGILRIESSALRSWIRVTSPRIWRGHSRGTDKLDARGHWANKEKIHPGGYVQDRVTRNRKIESLAEYREAGVRVAQAESNGESVFSADLSPKSKKA
ncbi:MAG: Sensory/regulatory protein RpfC, partial [Pseudomonadota bacterium]